MEVLLQYFFTRVECQKINSNASAAYYYQFQEAILSCSRISKNFIALYS